MRIAIELPQCGGVNQVEVSAHQFSERFLRAILNIPAE
jgi:hypothetical protein